MIWVQLNSVTTKIIKMAKNFMQLQASMLHLARKLDLTKSRSKLHLRDGGIEKRLQIRLRLPRVNSRKSMITYPTSEEESIVPIEHARGFLNAARSRFQGAIEANFSNDPLPALIPLEYPSLERVTHNTDWTATLNAVSNFLGNKCY